MIAFVVYVPTVVWQLILFFGLCEFYTSHG